MASDTDWSTEYLDKIISVKIVEGVMGAIEHINIILLIIQSQLLQRMKKLF